MAGWVKWRLVLILTPHLRTYLSILETEKRDRERERGTGAGGRERERERERERKMWERNIDQLFPIHDLTGDPTHHLLVYEMILQTSEPLGQGWASSVMDGEALCCPCGNIHLDFNMPFLTTLFLKVSSHQIHPCRPWIQKWTVRRWLHLEEAIWWWQVPLQDWGTHSEVAQSGADSPQLSLLAGTAPEQPKETSSPETACLHWLLSSSGPTFLSKSGTTLNAWLSLRDWLRPLL